MTPEVKHFITEVLQVRYCFSPFFFLRVRLALLAKSYDDARAKLSELFMRIRR
jgi:hypothetical protein